jgi:glucosamine--fructose-6-phosphate aminotransferase (isomerizing)
VCGIVGYVGEESAVPILLDGLRRLEYRGYDSAGVAVRTPDGAVVLRKQAGRVQALAEAVRAGGDLGAARIGIGHTRWATHGGPSDQNAHPHADERQAVAVVHNGIIENHAELRAALAARGHAFRSQTDSEVVAHLVEEALRAQEPGAAGGARLRHAVLRAVAELRGSFALVVLWAGAPDVLVAVRHQTPLVYGAGEGAGYLASDISALVPHTRRVVVLRDGEVAEVGPGGLRLFSFLGEPLPGRHPEDVAWDAGAAERGGYPHFMLKEIHEQPAALADSLRGRLGPDGPALGELQEPTRRALAAAPQVWLLGCGTAHHAGLVGASLLEAWARVPALADLGSEFRYRDPLVAPGALAVAVSQSGETADTLSALREARARGAHGLAVVNAVGSTIALEADDRLPTLAGPEISVCSTKAYTTQLEVLALLALQAAALRGTLPPAAVAGLADGLRRLPAWAEEALGLEAQAAGLAAALAPHEHCFFIGRGLDHAVALEGQLKLKEISYMHAEAYAAGELKHGTLALVTPGTPVVAVFTQPHLAPKTASNVAEVRARGGRVVGVCTAGLREQAARACEELMVLPDVPGPLAPVVAAIPLQLLAYHVAVARGTDVDKPRNLAKSVTVE